MINKEINKMIGNKLRKLRLEKDVSEKVIASVLGCEQSTYSRIEHGDIALSKPKAVLLASYYAIDVHDIYPSQENYNIENSFHSNSPASGNFNSTILQNDYAQLLEMLTTSYKNITDLVKITTDNQKVIVDILSRK